MREGSASPCLLLWSILKVPLKPSAVHGDPVCLTAHHMRWWVMVLSASLKCHMRGMTVVGCGGLGSSPIMRKKKGSGKWLVPLEGNSSPSCQGHWKETVHCSQLCASGWEGWEI